MYFTFYLEKQIRNFFFKYYNFNFSYFEFSNNMHVLTLFFKCAMKKKILYRVEITHMRVEITLERVNITLCVLKSHSCVLKSHLGVCFEKKSVSQHKYI
jgi:hypothetical protein